MAAKLSELERYKQAVRRLSWTLNQISVDAAAVSGDRLRPLASLALKEAADILDGRLNLYGSEKKNMRRAVARRRFVEAEK
jgi:hypothetical protein